MKIPKPKFASLEHLVAAIAEAVKPPERITVPEAAEKYRKLDNQGGGYSGPFRNDLIPYLIEPGEVLTDQDYTAMVFVGPSQSGKTELALSWVTHSAISDPADMTIISPTKEASRDFSNRRLQKLYLNTTALTELFFPGKGFNVFDTQFRNGMLLTLSHPSMAELRGKPIPRLWLTDYDAMDQDVDGEGSPFALARARARTFRRFAMTVAESSPGKGGGVITDPKWIPSTPHEAPPTGGILELYNMGDRRRLYWECPHCSHKFEPSFQRLRWPDSEDHVYSSERVVMVCPSCDGEMKKNEKYKLNLGARWIKDGMKWERDGRITGKPFRSDIASFWLKGAAAAFADWSQLVLTYLQAMENYERTGDEEALKTTTNTDQGDPYLPKSLDAMRLPEELKSRAEDWGGTKDDPVVPEGVRFLVAAVDVQGGLKPSFVVHVFGIGENLDIWHVDMFKIRKSERLDQDEEREWIDPASHPEDWHVLIDQVIEKSYPLSDDSGRNMSIKMTFCDSGGQAGVTTNAYDFYRYLRFEHEGSHHLRFQLVKGEPSKTAQRYVIKAPDSQRRDRHAVARGDVPVAFINSNTMKDTVFNMLGRDEPGGGQIHFPIWADDWLYMQLTAEVREPKGWISIGGKRNEAFDLLYYARAGLIDKRIRGEDIDWTDPPSWAAEWDQNDLVFQAEEDPRFMGAKGRRRRSLRELGGLLA